MKKYDYLIVGAGLFGSVFAYRANKLGKKCLVIDRRNHLGGNVYCKNIAGINVHMYGPHIFHTSDKRIWDFVNSFVPFKPFILSPIANYKGKLFNLPFNMNTFYQLWGVTDPSEAMRIIAKQRKILKKNNPKNLKEQAISLVGTDIYKKLIKGYTEKQWGCRAEDLPPFIIKRLPVRFTFDNNYFNDTYQGIPVGGYNKLIEGMLSGVKTLLNVDYIKNRARMNLLADKVVFTGRIDEYFGFKYGKLDYRSLRFENKILKKKNYQGVAQVNFTDKRVPYTRIIEHKHFESGDQENTVITKEYPAKWKKGGEAYYPINDNKNNDLYNKYKKLADVEKNTIFGGRLAEFKYYDMHQVIDAALNREL